MRALPPYDPRCLRLTHGVPATMAHGPQRRGSITCVRTAGPGGDSQPRHASISRSSPSPPVQQGKNHRLVVWLRGEIVDSSRASAIPAAGDPFLPLLERGVVRVRAVGRERIRLNGPASLTRWVPPLPPPPQLLLLLLVAPLSLPVSAAAQIRREQRTSAAQRRARPRPRSRSSSRLLSNLVVVVRRMSPLGEHGSHPNVAYAVL